MQIIDENILKLERLHLRVFDDQIDVLYRPNHNYLTFLNNNKDGHKELERLLTMTRDDFVDYLTTCSSLSSFKKEDIQSIQNGKLEEWYQGAWKMQTDKLLEELGFTNPIEEPIFSDEIFKRKHNIE